MKLKRHKHKFKIIGHVNMTGEWHCKCGDVVTRSLTSIEQKMIDNLFEKPWLDVKKRKRQQKKIWNMKYESKE